MVEPTINLFVDDSRESEEAWEILSGLGIRFHTLPSSGANLPAAQFGTVMFYGLPGILQLTATLRD